MNIKSKINQLISSFTEYLLYQKGLSQNTVDSYTSDLTKLSNYLQNQDLSKANIDNFFIDMSEFSVIKVFNIIKLHIYYENNLFQ